MKKMMRMSAVLPLMLAMLVCSFQPAAAARTSDGPATDIIAATLYGTEADVKRSLADLGENYMWRTYDGGTMDSREAALYYALACNRLQNVEVLLRAGVTWRTWQLHLGDMPYMEELCRKRLTAKIALKEQIAVEKDWAEGDVDGDCARGEHLYNIVSSPEALDILLRHDRELCRYRTQCGESLKQVLDMKQDAGRYLSVYRKHCR